MGVAGTRLRPRRALGVRGMREALAASTAGLLLIVMVGAGCDSRRPPASAAESAPVRLAKWKDGHRGAISVTYDNSNLVTDTQHTVQDAILALGVRVDFELVTGSLSDAKLERMRWLEAHRLGFFGHGARHVNHDRLSPEEARRSARSCYETMRSLGLKPGACAYPTGHARRPSPRDSVREAGCRSAGRREGGLRVLRLTLEDGLPDDRFDQPLTVLARPPRTWRGQRIELRDPEGRVVSGAEAPGDRTPLALDVPPD